MLNRNNVSKIVLSEEEIPRQWYNIAADMPNKIAPYHNPQTGKLLNPADMEAIFARELVKQEMSTDRYIDIPEEIRELYKSFRPSPLYRAKALEKALGTTARIYYKYEGGNATGSHKLNTAMAQAYYNKKEGIKRLSTETGAGQWGCALSMATQHFGLECDVYMVRVSYNQKPYRKIFMQTFGADVTPSPSVKTAAGRAILAEDPDSSGSLGIAISEAVEVAASRSDTNYALGSVLNHVCLHQSVIGIEAKKALEMIDEYPDVVIGCSGGGSNFMGISTVFMRDKIVKGSKVRCVAVEPASCPSLTKGVFAYDYGDTAKSAPIARMYTLGHDFMPSGIYAGGLRYHGASALLSQLYHDGYCEAVSYYQKEVFDAAVLFARTEGILPAPESSHAIKCAIDEAVTAREAGKSPVILFNLTGNGYFDMTAYESYHEGTLVDVPFDAAAMEKSLTKLPKID